MAWYDNLYVWTGLAVLSASAFIGLAYMLAKLFDLPALEGWVKVELRELAAGILIAAFCIALIASVNGASQFLSGSGSPSVIDSARQDFLRNTIYEDGRTIHKLLVSAYFDLAKLTSYSYTAGLSVGLVSFGYSSAPAAGLAPLQTELAQAIDGVSNFMLLAAAQSAFLIFFASAAEMLLPVGIFLRCFSLTRKAGGVLLAAVIATSVIYPAGILLSGEIYGSFRPGLLATAAGISVQPAPDPPIASVICSPYMQTFVMSPISVVGGEIGWFLTFCAALGWIPPHFFCSEAWYHIMQTVFYVINSLYPLLTYGALIVGVVHFEQGNWGQVSTDYYIPLRDYALPAVAQYSVLSLVSFLVPVIITVSLIRNLAVMFGGEPQLYGLSKLV